MGAPWDAVSGHTRGGGLNNPGGPSAENVEQFFVNTGGPPLP